MLHFSADRLAGLDAVVLKITTPPKVSALVPSHGVLLRCVPDSDLPAFLDFSARSLDPPGSTNNKVLDGPQWIPAFNHPNSPYVPWSSPVRRRILSPPSPLSPPACPSPPWAASSSSQTQNRSAKQRISSSWKCLKNAINKGVRTAVSRLGRPLCVSQGMLSTHDDTDRTTVAPDAVQSGPGGARRNSLASFVSSDSATLQLWLADRRANASRVADDAPREMSMQEYELVGSWLDLRRCDGGWLCGVQDCDVHTASGTPCAAGDYPGGLRMAMPFDCADMRTAVPRPSPGAPALSFPDGPFSAPARFHSLPRLHVHSARGACGERCLNGGRELSMPGGWTFN